MPDNQNFNPVSLFSIPPDEKLPFSVFIYYQGRYVEYRRAGQSLEVARYNRFIYKKISKLYISDADYEAYKEFVRAQEESEAAKLDDPSQSIEQKATNRTVRELNVAVREIFASSEEDFGENAAKVIDVAKSTVQRICERPYLRIFDSIPDSGLVLSHSMRVSVISTFLGYQLGFVNPIALENLAAAGILHDIGKTRLPLSDDLEVSEEQELEIMKQHSLLSVEMLKKSPLVPEEVLTIIIEHHERRDGSGYPKGLRGPRIHGLSRVLQIANEFDNLVSTMKGDREQKARQACQTMEKTMRNWFDPTLLPKALKILAGTGKQL